MARRRQPATSPSPDSSLVAPDAENVLSSKYLPDGDAPSLDELRALYEIAVRFRDAAPWTWVPEEQVFGVRNPETGEIGYCGIMGELGEHRALAVYRGTPGLMGLQKIKSGAFEGPMVDMMAMLNAQNCVMASFEDREEVEEPDRKAMKALGLRFRGKGAWPLFRSYVPGGIPWIVTGAEARFLTVALEQALGVAQRLREDPSLLPEPATEMGPFLVRVRDEDSGSWQDDQLMADPPPPEPEPLPTPLDAETIARLRALPIQEEATIEMDMAQLPEPVQESDRQRPLFPYLLLVAIRPPETPEPPAPKTRQVRGRRRTSVRHPAGAARKKKEVGPVVAAEPAMPSQAAARFPVLLAELIEQAESRPARIAVQDETTYNSLLRTAEALGIALSIEETPSVGAALLSFAGFMGGVDEDISDDEMSPEQALMSLLGLELD